MSAASVRTSGRRDNCRFFPKRLEIYDLTAIDSCSAQERPIQYGSEGLDSIENLELITRVNKCGETQMDE